MAHNERSNPTLSNRIGLSCLLACGLLAAGCDLGEGAELDAAGFDTLEDEHDEEPAAGPAAPGDLASESEPSPQTWNPANFPSDARNACFSQGRLPVIAKETAIAPCPALANWQMTRLVDKLPLALRSNIANDDPYRQYCEYVLDESVSDDDAAAHYDGLVAHLDTVLGPAAARDAGVACLTAMPMGLGDDTQLEGEFADIFFDSVGRVDPVDLAQVSGHDVNIFLVDNWAGAGSAFPAQDEHGENLGRMLEALTSGAEDDIDIVPLVGLPRMDGDVGTVLPGGGVKGTAPDISVAFMHAAALHIEDNGDGTPVRSIVNASLGGPELSADALVKYSTRALVDATRTLACLGMQVNFAAGNELPGESVCGVDPTGLLFPANFDGSFAAPTQAECTAMGYAPVESPWFYAYGSWQPNAVSGMDAAGGELPNARTTGSRTKLVANGVAAHTYASDSFMLTGTSVSTAVMSAASALEWWLNPAMSAHDTSAQVALSGDPLAWTADAGSHAGETARAINICETISDDLAIFGIPLNCPVSPAAPYDALGPIIEGLSDTAQKSNELFVFSAGSGSTPSCLNLPLGFDVTDEMLNPSPTRPACDNCSAGTEVQGQSDQHTAYLGMSLAPWASQLSVDDAYLVTKDTNGNKKSIPLAAAVVSQMNAANTGTMIEVDFSVANLAVAKLQLNYSDATTTVTSLPLWSASSL